MNSNCRLIHEFYERKPTGLVPVDFLPVIMEPSTRLELVNLVLTKDALYQLSYKGLNVLSRLTSTTQPL